MTYSSLKMVQSSRSRGKTVVGPPRDGAVMAESCKVGCRRVLLHRLRWYPGQSAVVCSVAAGFGVTLHLWGNASFLISLCVSLQRAVIFMMWCLAESSTPQQRSDTDLCLRLWDILVLVPYPCRHLGCSSQCFPWLPFLFAFSGREFSGLRAWFSLVFVLRLGCHGCKQSQSH